MFKQLRSPCQGPSPHGACLSSKEHEFSVPGLESSHVGREEREEERMGMK